MRSIEITLFIILTVSLISGCAEPFDTGDGPLFEEGIYIDPLGGGGGYNYNYTWVSGRLFWDFDEDGNIEPLIGNTNVWAFKVNSIEVDSTSGRKVLTDSSGKYLILLSGVASYIITAKKQSTNLQLWQGSVAFRIIDNDQEDEDSLDIVLEKVNEFTWP